MESKLYQVPETKQNEPHSQPAPERAEKPVAFQWWKITYLGMNQANRALPLASGREPV